MFGVKQTDKKRSPTINQARRPAKVESREAKLQQEKSNKTLRSKEGNKNTPSARSNNNIVVTDRKKNIKPYENNEKLGVNYTDKVSTYRHDKPSTDLYKESNNGREESDSETITDSISSCGDSPSTEHDLSSQVNTPTSISNNSKGFKVHAKPPSSASSITSEGFDGPDLEEPKEMDILDEVRSDGSNEEMLDAMESIEHEAKDDLDPRIAKMEMRIEQLEDELREVAALEISLYSAVQEHGNSAHKVHKPAQHLSRLYIRTSKQFSQQKRATIGRNIVSGLVMISTSCGNDVARLTFWWSNIVVLREIITQAFGSKQSNNNNNVNEFVDDWQESRTFTSELEKVESEIFSRIVESIWCQTLMPKMLTDVTMCDQQQINFSINLWQNAFYDAFKRLCPVRAKGRECGCLPTLARMVMEHCVARLDVAMFNAILHDTSLESPTDSVSDPITESRVLPIPAGDLSFGSGAQLKKAVGNWSRWLTDRFPVDTDAANEYNTTFGEIKWFHLLDSLSNLLMVPKDLIMDRLIRTEICPSISLQLLKQILCGFTPDEFCPDPVPQTVIEAVNAECIAEGISSEDKSSRFAQPAVTIIYKPPSSTDVGKKVYEEVEDMDSSHTFIIGNLNGNIASYVGANARYKLLHEVWSS